MMSVVTSAVMPTVMSAMMPTVMPFVAAMCVPVTATPLPNIVVNHAEKPEKFSVLHFKRWQ